jgi:hypothetical protein
MFQDIEPITLRSSLKSIHFRLWDDERLVLVGFNNLEPQAEKQVTSRVNT